MTHVLFCHGAEDRLLAATRWLLQAVATSAHLPPVCATLYLPDDAQARQMGALLWSLEPGSFLPHCPADAPLADQTPLLIARNAQELEHSPRTDLLINLADELPPHLGRFTQLVEIVSQDAQQREQARERVRHYREHQHPVQFRDLQQDPFPS